MAKRKAGEGGTAHKRRRTSKKEGKQVVREPPPLTETSSSAERFFANDKLRRRTWRHIAVGDNAALDALVEIYEQISYLPLSEVTDIRYREVEFDVLRLKMSRSTAQGRIRCDSVRVVRTDKCKPTQKMLSNSGCTIWSSFRTDHFKMLIIDMARKKCPNVEEFVFDHGRQYGVRATTGRSPAGGLFPATQLVRCPSQQTVRDLSPCWNDWDPYARRVWATPGYDQELLIDVHLCKDVTPAHADQLRWARQSSIRSIQKYDGSGMCLFDMGRFLQRLFDLKVGIESLEELNLYYVAESLTAAPAFLHAISLTNLKDLALGNVGTASGLPNIAQALSACRHLVDLSIHLDWTETADTEIRSLIHSLRHDPPLRLNRLAIQLARSPLLITTIGSTTPPRCFDLVSMQASGCGPKMEVWAKTLKQHRLLHHHGRYLDLAERGMRELGVHRGCDVVNITFDLCSRAVGVLHSLVNRAIELVTSTNTKSEYDRKTLDLLQAVADEADDSPAGDAARRELYDSLNKHTAQ